MSDLLPPQEKMNEWATELRRRAPDMTGEQAMKALEYMVEDWRAKQEPGAAPLVEDPMLDVGEKILSGDLPLPAGATTEILRDLGVQPTPVRVGQTSGLNNQLSYTPVPDPEQEQLGGLLGSMWGDIKDFYKDARDFRFRLTTIGSSKEEVRTRELAYGLQHGETPSRDFFPRTVSGGLQFAGKNVAPEGSPQRRFIEDAFGTLAWVDEKTSFSDNTMDTLWRAGIPFTEPGLNREITRRPLDLLLLGSEVLKEAAPRAALLAEMGLEKAGTSVARSFAGAVGGQKGEKLFDLKQRLRMAEDIGEAQVLGKANATVSEEAIAAAKALGGRPGTPDQAKQIHILWKDIDTASGPPSANYWEKEYVLSQDHFVNGVLGEAVDDLGPSVTQKVEKVKREAQAILEKNGVLPEKDAQATLAALRSQHLSEIPQGVGRNRAQSYLSQNVKKAIPPKRVRIEKLEVGMGMVDGVITVEATSDYALSGRRSFISPTGKVFGFDWTEHEDIAQKIGTTVERLLKKDWLRNFDPFNWETYGLDGNKLRRIEGALDRNFSGRKGGWVVIEDQKVGKAFTITSDEWEQSGYNLRKALKRKGAKIESSPDLDFEVAASGPSRMKVVEDEWAAGAELTRKKTVSYIGDRKVSKIEADYFESLDRNATPELFEGITGKPATPSSYLGARTGEAATELKGHAIPGLPTAAERRKLLKEAGEEGATRDLFGQPGEQNTYRTWLEQVTGKDSVTKLNYAERDHVIEELTTLKWFMEHGGVALPDPRPFGRAAISADMVLDHVGALMDGGKKTLAAKVWANKEGVLRGHTWLDPFRDTMNVAREKLGPVGEVLTDHVLAASTREARFVDGYTRTFQSIFGDVKRGTNEDVYLGAILSKQESKLPKELLSALSDEVKTDLHRKAIKIRGLFDKMILRANSMRKRLGVKEIPYRKDYFPSIYEDSVFQEFVRDPRSSFDPMTKEVFFRFANPRKGETVLVGAIDGVEAYLPVWAKHVSWSPVRHKWGELKKLLPESGPRISRINAVVEEMDDWVRYASGSGSKYSDKFKAGYENFLINTLGAGSEAKLLRRAKAIEGFGNYVANYGYFTLLGGNIPAAAKNLTQSLNVILSEQVAMTDVAAAVALQSTLAGRKVVNRIIGLLGHELVAGRKLETMIEAIGLEQGALFPQFGRGLSGIPRKMMEIALSPFSMAERANRRFAALSAVISARRRGLSSTEAIRFARRLVRSTQWDFSPAGQIPILRGGGQRLLFQFMRFPLQQSALYAQSFIQEPVAGLLQAGRGVRAGEMSQVVQGLSRTGKQTLKNATYMTAAAGLAYLTAKVGMGIGSAFPDFVLEPIRDLSKWVTGASEEDVERAIPGGQGLAEGLPGTQAAPFIGATKEFFTESGVEGRVTGLPRGLESVVVPYNIRKGAEAENVRATGEIQNSRGERIRDADISAGTPLMEALFGSTDYVRTAFGFLDPQTAAEYHMTGEERDADRNRDEKRKVYLDGMVQSLRGKDMERFRSLVQDALGQKVRRTDGREVPLFGSVSKDGGVVIPSEELYQILLERMKEANMTLTQRMRERLATIMQPTGE